MTTATTKAAREISKARLAKAHALGVAAFKNGLGCVPARDRAIMILVFDEPREVGNRNTTRELKAWYKGWHEANNAAYVPGFIL